MTKEIRGTGVALVTPFHTNGNINFKALDALVKHMHKGNVDFLVALGTTAETATLTEDEKSTVLSAIIDSNEGKLPIVVGAGSNNTRQLVSSVKRFENMQIDALLSVAPYYNKPNQKGMHAHFKELALNTKFPIILYNVPGRTASNLLPETIIALAESYSNIIGVKEASGNLMQVMDIIKNRPKGFKVFSGDDALTLPMISLGADGVISVIANAYPAAMSEMVNLLLTDKDRKKAIKIHYQMLDVTKAMFADGNPAGVKAFLELIGLMDNSLRLPMVKVNRSLANEIKRLYETCNL